MSENTKHTPGPWVKGDEKHYRREHVFTNNGVFVADCCKQPPREECEANARLIAAAPDMLAALREIAEGRGAYKMDRLAFAESVIENMKGVALAAIAKAEDPELRTF
jgi:hypothetical protein